MIWDLFKRCLPAQIDVRFGNPEQGKLSVVVAPVLRFAGRPLGLPLSHACARRACCQEVVLRCSWGGLWTCSMHDRNSEIA